MKTAGEKFFDQLDGIPCHHGQVNGWHCFRCAIDFFDRVIIPAARAAGYAAGMAYAIEKSAEVTDSFGHRGLSDLIRALAPPATTEEP